jgi:putative FmdB family regulatory protein
MPTYVYECPRCGEFELRHSISEPARERCPTCGAAVRRLIAGGPSFIVRGRGAEASHCQRQAPCCGRETRCGSPPCRK